MGNYTVEIQMEETISEAVVPVGKIMPVLVLEIFSTFPSENLFTSSHFRYPSMHI